MKGLKIMRTLNKVNVIKNDTIETYAHCSQCTSCSCGKCVCPWVDSNQSNTDRDTYGKRSLNVYNNTGRK